MIESFAVSRLAAPSGPQPLPVPPPPVLTWYLCDLASGLILTELPLVASSVKVQAATEDQQSFTLDTADPSCPDDWATLLVDGKSMIVLTIDDQPTAGWWVIDHTVGAQQVPITAYTFEHCAARTNVPDVEINTPTDVSTIALDVAAPLITRFGFFILPTLMGKTRDTATYQNSEDRSILDALTEDFLKADDGPEWRFSIRWMNTETRTGFDKILEIAPTIGIDRPDAIFDLDADGQGCIDSYTRQSSYATGKGATMMIGVSDGSGSTRPMTDPIYSPLTQDGWPTVEDRHPFTGLDLLSVQDEDAKLVELTTALLQQRQTGTVSWSVTGSADAPMPGRDYGEGDTVHIDVAPQGKQDPIGGKAAVRALGWELDPATTKSSVIVWPDDDNETSV